MLDASDQPRHRVGGARDRQIEPMPEMILERDLVLRLGVERRRQRALDAPFVDVLVKHESMGPDQYELSDDELSVVGIRSGDTISLGDRLAVVIEDVAILRRQTLARR